MRKSQRHIKLAFTVAIFFFSLMNLTQMLHTDSWNCNSYSDYCADVICNQCEHTCRYSGDCAAIWFDWGLCWHGLCEQYWDYQCGNGDMTYGVPCIAGDKYCPWK
jgi:hypothetical protein